MYPYRQLPGLPPIFGPGSGQGPGGGFGPPGQGFGPPGQGPGGFGPPGQGGGQGGPPPGPPPSSPPPEVMGYGAGGPTAFAVDPGAMRRCLFRYTWVRLNNGEGFWFWPTYIGRRSVAGYRWWFFTWIYFGIDTNRIRSFQCF
ncbi:hypothetical protein LC085_15035 [Bacillus tianshenii]|uniref:hypothetical protein n=1 Tax=Sutcliffiella tianshenii TaxID=1463404 RepID=UPI001CD3229F|nr:hypothetical protein [Bacillus tianshenii]MCA1321235.1 hypothetical protein [Bacillus tianshenii]